MKMFNFDVYKNHKYRILFFKFDMKLKLMISIHFLKNVGL